MPLRKHIVKNASPKSTTFEMFTLHDFTKCREKSNIKEEKTTQWKKIQRSRNLQSSKTSKLKLKKNEGRSPSIFCNSKLEVFEVFKTFEFFLFCCVFFFCVAFLSKFGEIMKSKKSKNCWFSRGILYCNNVLSHGHEMCNERHINLIFNKFGLGVVIWFLAEVPPNEKFLANYWKSYDVPLMCAV